MAITNNILFKVNFVSKDNAANKKWPDCNKNFGMCFALKNEAPLRITGLEHCTNCIYLLSSLVLLHVIAQVLVQVGTYLTVKCFIHKCLSDDKSTI
jgi:hypothetical protein